MMKIFSFIYLLCLTLCAPALAGMELVDRSEGKGNFIYENSPRSFLSTIMVVLPIGSMNDTKGKEGLASLSFKSLLRGTKKLDRRAYIFATEELGADISMYVGTDRVILNLSGITSNLQKSISLLGDVLLDRFLRKNQFENLKKEIVGALNNTKNNLRAMTGLAFRRALFSGSVLAHPPGGTINGLNSITYKEASSFLDKNITQERALFAVSSSVEKSTVKSWIQESFGKMSIKGNKIVRVNPRIPKLSGRHVVIFPQKEGGLTEVYMGHPSVPSGFKNGVALKSIGAFTLGKVFSGRLFKELRVKKGWTYGAYASFRLFDLPRYYGSVFQIYTFPSKIIEDREGRKKPVTEEAIFRIIELYEDYVNKGITEEEKKFAVDFNHNAYGFIFEKASTRMVKRIYQALEGEPFLSIKEYQSKLRNIDVSSLNSMIKTGTYVVGSKGNKEDRRRIHDPLNMVIALGGDPELLLPIVRKIPGVKSIKIVTDPITPLKPTVKFRVRK